MLVAVATIGGVLSACGSSGGTASGASGAASTQSLTIDGFQGIVTSQLVKTAIDRGFFKKNHLNVKIQFFTSDTAVLAAHVSGALPLISISPLDVIIADSKGATLRFVQNDFLDAADLVAGPGVPSTGSSYPHSMLGLKGKTVGSAALSGVLYDTLQLAVSSSGLASSAVHYAAVGVGASAVAALKAGTVQAVILNPPLSKEVLAEVPGSHLIFSLPTSGPALLQNLEDGGFAADSPWITSHHKEVTEFLAGLEEAYAWASKPADFRAWESEVASLIPGLSPTILKSTSQFALTSLKPVSLPENAALVKTALQRWNNFAKAVSITTTAVPTSDMIQNP
jgi:ABC-type nitrate/sulfonate/bicarbonate transport system substrate-binding protein